ncbi:MAG: hypothetical protein Q7U08_04150 [Flavobacteriaceae bacterium]|nr:hypothetical protein [Flavobacteriaceae bacterium]
MLLFVSMFRLLKKYAKSIFLLLKIALILTAFYLIYKKIWIDNGSIAFNLFANFSLLQLICIVFLMLILSALNWMLEFYKWKILVTSIQRISFSESMQQCLTAHVAALITPFKMGEFGVKAMFFAPKNIPKILYLNFLGNASQLLMTLVFGFVGFYFYQHSLSTIFGTSFNPNYLFILMFLIVAVLMFRFLSKQLKFDFWKNIPVSVHLKNIGFSMSRYLVFSHQWLFLLYLIKPDIVYFNTISAIFSMYLLATLIPTFAMLDWAIKGFIALFLFAVLGFRAAEILSISLLMWFFNFAIPAVMGSYFMLKLNRYKSLKHE